jgi:hypothetical protein
VHAERLKQQGRSGHGTPTAFRRRYRQCVTVETLQRESNGSAEYRAGAEQVLNGLNHGPFGEKNFFIANGHWPYGPRISGNRGA